MARSSAATSDRRRRARRRPARSAFALAVLLALAAALSGCRRSGLELEPVTGEVLYQGLPVAGARVTFVATESPRAAVGATDATGRFTLTTMTAGDGAVVGTHQVAITDFTPEAIARMSTAQQEALGRGGKVPGSVLPTKYASLEKSGLSATVEAGGKNEFRFDLTD